MRPFRALSCFGWLIVPLLVGCGGGATATPVPPSPTPAPTVTTSAARGQDCGTVEVRANRVANAAATQQATDCFWRAYQQCATAGRTTLTEVQTGVDTITRRIFSIEGAGANCPIREDVETRVVPAAPRARTNTCAGVMRRADGSLQFQACGDDGNPVVPPSA
jgi:hypothetical protein